MKIRTIPRALLHFLLPGSLILSGCIPAAQTVIRQTVRETVVVTQVQTVVKQVVVTATPTPNPEAVIPDVEPDAQITLWTYWLSDFKDYIQSTIARFEQTYPGVTVHWEDHASSFLQDYRAAMAAGTAPDVANLSDTEGWVREFASRGQLLSMTDNLPKSVIDSYYPGLFNLQLVDGKSYQVPWYQAVPVMLVNRQIYDKTGLDVRDFPQKLEDLGPLCLTVKLNTSTRCNIGLDMNDLLRDMAYQGGVKVYDEQTKKFTFDSAEGVAWLQMYVDWLKVGIIDPTALTATDYHVGLDQFDTGNVAFYQYQTGPQLVRSIRDKNPGMYGYLEVAPVPEGKSGAIPPTSMALSVRKDTKYPRAALALAAFFTDARSQLEFSKIVAVYPSTPASYEDPFFLQTPIAVEEGARPMARLIIPKMADIVPQYPNPSQVNDLVSQAVQQALFGSVASQRALTDAAVKANALIH
jgi:ABC-type glycerol-3-phosphate transport system substrate-binding protein